MHSAGRRHSLIIPITPVRTSSDSLRIAAACPLASAAAETEVILTPGGFESAHTAEAGYRTERDRQLAVVIRQRIESRLGGRVRNLAIRFHGDTIVLEGRCTTFYTKQLAQHAALGVLEHEQLDNAIIVTM